MKLWLIVVVFGDRKNRLSLTGPTIPIIYLNDKKNELMANGVHLWGPGVCDIKLYRYICVKIYRENWIS